LYTTDLHYTENGYMHRIGFASGGFPVFNGFQDRAHSPGSGAGLSRMYFPLCGEDLLRSRALIKDTIIADSLRGYLSHYVFDLEVELRNVDDARAAHMVRCSIEPPEGLMLQHGETIDKQPEPAVIPPGGVATVSWRVQLDTTRLGGWAGLRDLLLLVRFTHEYQLSTSLASCLTSFSFNELPLVVKRDDSENDLVCSVATSDTLRVRADGRGYDPPLLPVTGEVRNSGAGETPAATAVLRLGRMGPALDPSADSLRAVPVLTPGGAHAVQWRVRPARRADTRRIALRMVVRDERGELTRCTQEVVVPGLRPVSCDLSLPDTVLIMKDGSTVPPDIIARVRLENVLDTLISGLDARIDLGGIPELGLASGESAGRRWDYVQGGRDVTAHWALRVAEDVRAPVRVDVPVRYRCASDTTWRECIASMLLHPLHSDLYCGISLPATHPASLVESRAMIPLDYTLTNTGTVPAEVDRLELAIGPAKSGLAALDPVTLSGTQLAAGALLPWNVRLRATILRATRTAMCTVTAYGKSAGGEDSVLSVCDAAIDIEGVDGLRCAVTAPDTVRFDRDSLRYVPDPVPVVMDLSNVLDTGENAIEVEIDLSSSPRLTLADGEIARKTRARLDSHSTARFTWLLTPIAAATDDIQDIVIRYRSVEQGGWKECGATVVVSAWPEIVEITCSTGGHDSLFADAAYELIVPEPFQVSYTATNSGTVTLTGCAAAIVLPEGFALIGSDSIQSFGANATNSLAPGESATRWWTVMTTDQLQGFGSKDVAWAWSSDQQGSGTGCTHPVQVIPDPSSGIVLTPLRLYFEAELGGALPMAQAVKLWTGGRLSMPWTAQSDTWYIDLAPVAGDHAASISVRPNTTMLNTGMHASTITLAGAAPNLPRHVAVDYLITSLTGVEDEPTARAFTLGAVYPHPIPLLGEARLLLRANGQASASGVRVRITLHDLLGRERAMLHDGVITETDVLLLRPAPMGLEPGNYLLRMLAPGGWSARMLTVVR
jgi:hypothetical protein